jgi:hypothetical protein
MDEAVCRYGVRAVPCTDPVVSAGTSRLTMDPTRANIDSTTSPSATVGTPTLRATRTAMANSSSASSG